MAYERLIDNCIFVLFFLIQVEAIRRGGTSKSRIGTHSYSAGNLHEEALDDPGRALLALTFMIISCGGGIVWRLYRFYRKRNESKLIQQRLPYPNNIYTNSTSSSDRLNEIELPIIKSILVPLPVELLEYQSEKAISNKNIEQIPIPKTNQTDIPELTRMDRMSTLL